MVFALCVTKPLKNLVVALTGNLSICPINARKTKVKERDLEKSKEQRKTERNTTGNETGVCVTNLELKPCN